MKNLELEILKIIRDAQVNRDRMLADGAGIWPGDYLSSDSNAPAAEGGTALHLQSMNECRTLASGR